MKGVRLEISMKAGNQPSSLLFLVYLINIELSKNGKCYLAGVSAVLSDRIIPLFGRAGPSKLNYNWLYRGSFL